MGIRLCKSSACFIIPKLWDCHPLACPLDLAMGSEPGLGPASWERGGVVALFSWWLLFFSPTLLHIYNSMPGLLFATSPKPTCSEGQLPGSLVPQSQSVQLCKFWHFLRLQMNVITSHFSLVKITEYIQVALQVDQMYLYSVRGFPSWIIAIIFMCWGFLLSSQASA